MKPCSSAWRPQGGADRELDADVYEAFGYDVKRAPERPGAIYWRFYDQGRWCVMGDLTRSVDDAVAFLKRVLPGCLWAIGSMEDGPFCRLVALQRDGGFIGGSCEASAATTALSAVAALLRALIAQRQPVQHEGEVR